MASHIRNLIIRGKLGEGDYLPPEAQLAVHYTTSRPTIREAMRILENERLISIVRGSRAGARVRRPSVDNVARSAGFVLQASGATLADIYEARLGIECQAAGLAAERRTPAMVEQLRAQYGRICEFLAANDAKAFRVEIAHFHQSIVDCSGNQTLQLMTRLLQGVIEKHQSQYHLAGSPFGRLRGRARKDFYESGLKSLETIIDLIETQDRAGAEAHWRKHMEHANHVWLSGYDGTAIVDVLG